MSQRRFLKPGWLIVLCLVIFVFYKLFLLFFGKFELEQETIIQQWDTISRLMDPLSFIEKTRVKLYLYRNPSALRPLQLGSYVFSWDYSPSLFILGINDGPQKSYNKMTILEGWSIYDIDDMLTKKKLISPGEYVSAVSDVSGIDDLSLKYPFLSEFVLSKSSDSPLTLEWLLYPDTYYFDPNQPIIDQLISMQLSAFYEKVYKIYDKKIQSFSTNLLSNNYSFSLWFYNIITLASIIEKEERNPLNKPVIAWIFLNRIANDMRIDADITLCYGLHQWYESCTPSLIARSISDTYNLYNTRVHKWLTPTPISNPSVSTITSLLSFEKTDYLFYLHDSSGKIWYSKDLQWHNINKSKHL